MNSLPSIPLSAPFTAEQRLWLNGYIAGLISEDTATPSLTSAPARVRVPVLYASQSGNSEGLAEEFAESLGRNGFDSPCLSTEDIDEIDLTKERFLLLVSSTWGEGDPPDNAVEFWNQLQDSSHPTLEKLQYSVLALGDSNYLEFCAQGKAFDLRLEELGATRICPRIDCDTDFEEPAAEWFRQVSSALEESTGKEPASPSTASSSSKPKEVGYSKKNPFPALLKANVPLNEPDSERDTRHFEFSLTGSGLSYEAGDVLGVYPKNSPAMADEIIRILGLSPDELVSTPESGERPFRTALIEDFDIRTLSAKTLSDWAKRVSSDDLSSLLKEKNKEHLENYLWGRELIDLLTDHPANFSSAGEFVSLLRKLGPRLYSISSSPKAHPDEVHLTVAKVTYESHGRSREGVCSTFLSDRVKDDETVPVFFQPAAHFKLPTDTSTDLIMCGPGTGIAPFRAFLEEREATDASGRNWLFFGNPHETTDFLYRDQLLSMKDKGVLHRFDLAWSRDGESKVYVQDKIRESGEEIWQWLDGGAHFYVCGDAKRMAKDVDLALKEVASKFGNMSVEQADEFISQLKKEKRYQRDVY